MGNHSFDLLICDASIVDVITHELCCVDVGTIDDLIVYVGMGEDI